MIKDTIYTIPISDVFDPKCGCPLCRMQDMLESRSVEYVIGAAMMEPDIRIETNKHGFCSEHFSQLRLQKNKLSLALIMETHLDEVMKKHMPHSVKKGSERVTASCYICKEIDSAAEKMVKTAIKLYFTDESFKKLFLEQELFCMPHYERLCELAFEVLPKKQSAVFVEDITKKMQSYTQVLRDKVHCFTLTFDYRNADADKNDETVTAAVDNAISFLTGKKEIRKGGKL